ncbi:MAG: alpha/beta family hydrolase, partial [Thiohalorhabdaceae bacterium]
MTIALAHGAGAPMDSPFMADVAAGLGTRGWRVARFEFPYMARRRADGKLEVPHEEVEPADVQATPRVHTMDIEVDDRRGFPEEGEEPIVCLTSHDSYDDEY